MSKVDRREFLKLVGAGSVGAGAGFMLAQSVRHPVEHLIPYPVPPEEFSPGIATWYNSVCGMCPAGCGITVRTREGRAKKIEGNPLHPVNQGRLCALGQAGLQLLYNPDRVTQPLRQSGARGSNAFEPVSWQEAIAVVADRLDAAGDNRIVLLSDGVRGRLATVLETFVAELGGELLQFDLAYPHALQAATRRLFGEAWLPYYDLANADYVVSFGADYLNNWLSPVHHGIGFGHSRQGRDHRGRFVQIEPRMSLSGAAADDWIPARPGSEGLLALAIAREIVAGPYRGDDASAWRSALEPYAPQRVADATGVTAATIVHLATALAGADAGLAIGGGAASAHTNGVDTLVAVNALNYLIGNIGRPGGVIFNPQPAVAGGAGRRANFRSMQQLAERARGGDIDVLIVSNANPLFGLPSSAGFGDALAAIPTVVSLSPLMDETTLQADFVLPSHTYLESWGDDAPQPGVGFSIASVSQPVVAPLFNTRATGDIVLELGRRLGFGDAMPWASMQECVREAWRDMHAQSGEPAEAFDDFWRDVLVSGVWGTERRGAPSATIASDVISGLGMADAEFAGNSETYPLLLQPYLSTALYDGRGANLPWMQELPDPMTSVVYGSWLEMNPATADDLGVRDGDLVRIESVQGSIEAPVVRYPAIRPDVVAMPIGQGHEALGRYARHRGVNPLHILAPSIDPDSGDLASGATRVSVTATGRRAPAITIGGESRELGRNIIQRTGAPASDHSASLRSIPIVVEQS